VAEWLGRGLQSLAHRFDSGRRLSRVRMAGAVVVYACAVCGRPAPALDSTEILEWQGGELATAGQTEPLTLNLVCPDSLQETRPDDVELGAGD
jgi:hypothetical protein